MPDDRPPGRPAAPPRARTRPADTRPATTRRPGARTARSASQTAVPAAVRTVAHAVRTPVAAPPPAPAVPLPPAPPVPAQGAGRAVPQPCPADLFAERLLAVLSGRRPVHAMLRHTRGRAYDELARLAERGPLRTRGAHPVVRDLGWFAPRPGAVEVFARIGAGDRLRAMAFRLECGPDLRWRCTAVELGGPREPHPSDG
ncbi:hypothetical protein GCM10023220_46680 [Streptomyces ziwulingensis]|uniref:Uncharacterized protein n=2 Tax=Streptomyces ziwulingensis TaxID=1045501 RepID=A0ABP9CLB6_9ACTN